MNTPNESTKWDKLRINKKYLRSLLVATDDPFTNDDGYRLYWALCATKQTKERVVRLMTHLGRDVTKAYAFDSWITMNVRNQLSKLAHIGVLERLEPGKYTWAPILTSSVMFWDLIDQENAKVDEYNRERKLRRYPVDTDFGKHLVSTYEVGDTVVLENAAPGYGYLTLKVKEITAEQIVCKVIKDTRTVWEPYELPS